MNNFTHNGFDMFFNNISNKKAKLLVQCLNNMNRTMNGEQLKFKLNRNHPRSLSHQTNATVITVRYADVTANSADLMLGLNANRKIGEGFAKAIGSGVTYEGSEFYIDGNINDISKDIDNLVDNFKSHA